jgi:ADP-glucose pyrophosphorylase
MHTLAILLAGGAGSRLSVHTRERAVPTASFAGKCHAIASVLRLRQFGRAPHRI